MLVSTTVVEVGVDVPNATVMVVEHAERFGLSQLHQLRGRIGRGAWESHCVLLYQSPWTDEARERLSTMASTTDGFAIAERDLELRGPGDFFGTRQSGLPRLRTGDLVRDRDVMEEAHHEARAMVEAGPLDAGAGRLRAPRDGRPGSAWRRWAATDGRPSDAHHRRATEGPPAGDAHVGGLRPTSDKLRETLFNILGARIDRARACSTCLPARAPSGSKR